MSPERPPFQFSRTRRYALGACVLWTAVYVWLGGPAGVADVLITRPLAEIIAIQFVNAFFSALAITELSRLAFPRWRLWHDKQHFTTVAIWCVVLTVVTTWGILMMRHSSDIS